MGRHPPFGQRSFRILFFKSVGRVERALSAEGHSQRHTHDGATEVTFPADVVVNGQHPPHNPSVQEGHRKAHTKQKTVVSNDAAGEQEGCQTIDDAAGTDVVAVDREPPKEQAAGKKEPQPNPQCDASIEVKEEAVQGEKAHGVVPQVSQISMQERVGQHPGQSFPLPRMNAVFAPPQSKHVIQGIDRPNGQQKRHGEPQGVRQAHAVRHLRGRSGQDGHLKSEDNQQRFNHLTCH